MDYIQHQFPNGLRAIAARSDGHVSYTGVLINAGSRDDGTATPGLAHFVEHTIFKGTPKRNSLQVTNRMEQIGGEINAFTAKEETCIYTTAPGGYEGRALELISDLVQNASFPLEDVNREREVIAEEISSCRDNPVEYAFDEFETLIYAGSELSHNILGTEKSIELIGPAETSRYLQTYYAPNNMVLYSLAPADPAKTMRTMERYFAGMAYHDVPTREKTGPAPLFDETRNLGHHQGNTLMGTRIFSYHDPRRHALTVLNNILGGPGMNSRLNQQLRERRGLVYSVDSYTSLNSDCGIFLVYFGSDPSKTDKCVSLIRKEIEKLAEKPLSDRAFSKAIEQHCGQILVRSDNRRSSIMGMTTSLMHSGEIHDAAWRADRLREVTPKQVQEIAQLLADSEFSRLTVI